MSAADKASGFICITPFWTGIVMTIQGEGRAQERDGRGQLSAMSITMLL